MDPEDSILPSDRTGRHRNYSPWDRDTRPNAPGEADPNGTHPLQIKAQEKRRRKAAKLEKET